MPEYRIDLRSRFESAFGASLGRIAESALGFGYRVVPRITDPAQLQSAFVMPAPPVQDEPEYYSALGTPIYDRFVFSVTGTDYELLLPPMVDLSNDKRISVTPINDNDFDVDNLTGSEVVESWGNSPWQITFRGILVDMVNHARPLNQVRELVEVFKANSIVEVKSSRLFNALGIRELYITRIELPAMEHLDTQAYILHARSYVPAELILN